MPAYIFAFLFVGILGGALALTSLANKISTASKQKKDPGLSDQDAALSPHKTVWVMLGSIFLIGLLLIYCIAIHFGVLPPILSYAALMRLLFLAGTGFTIYGFWRLSQYKKAHGKPPTSAAVSMVVSAVLCALFFFNLSGVTEITVKDPVITDITNVYNKDGTLKYDKNGDPVLETHYGESGSHTTYGNNFLYLIFPLAIGGVLVYGFSELKKASRKE